jgi:hypothetical protein
MKGTAMHSRSGRKMSKHVNTLRHVMRSHCNATGCAVGKAEILLTHILEVPLRILAVKLSILSEFP